MFSGLESPTHLLIILVIILLLFGAKRLPEFGRSLGRGIQEFKEGLSTKDEPDGSRPETVERVEEPSAEAVREQQKEEATRTKGPEAATRRESP